MSTCKLSEDELELLKHGLDFAIQPRSVNKTDVFASFEMLHRVLTKEVKNEEARPELKTEMSHPVRNYYDTSKPSQSSLNKRGILKKLQRNEGIIIVKPDKGNGVIILDRNTHHNSLLTLISDASKFSRSRGDETVRREGSLQRFLRNLKKQMRVHMNRFILSVLCLPDCMDSPRCTKSSNLGEIPHLGQLFLPLVHVITSLRSF